MTIRPSEVCQATGSHQKWSRLCCKKISKKWFNWQGVWSAHRQANIQLCDGYDCPWCNWCFSEDTQVQPRAMSPLLWETRANWVWRIPSRWDQAQWNIVKQHRLCHVCLKPGHMSHCQSRIFCQCGSTEDITSCCTTPLEGSEVWLNIQLVKSPIFLWKQSCLTLRKWLRDHNSQKDHEPLSSTPPIPKPLCLQESFCCMLYLSGW